ncbi:MAG: ABC transporter permease [Pseudomonadota bacterium]
MALFPPLLTIVLIVPVLAGLLGVLLPSFGYLPWLGFDRVSLDPWRSLLETPGLAWSVWLSLKSGLLAAALSLAVVALFLAAFHGTGPFRVARRFLSPLLSVPHAAAALGLAFLVAPSGWIMRLVSPELTGFERPPDYLVVHDAYGLTMTAGLVAKEIPFLFLMALAALPQIDFRRDLWIASSFGYGRIAGWLFVVFPQVYRQIRLPVFAVLAYSVSVVDVAIILGPTTPPPLAVRLVTWMNDPDLSLRLQASAGAVLQLLVAALAVGLWLALERGIAALGRLALQKGWRFAADRVLRIFAFAAMFTALLAIAVGLALMAVWSVAGPWRFPDAWPAMVSFRVWTGRLASIEAAVAATALIGILAVLIGIGMVLAALEARNRASARNPLSRPLVVALYAPLLVPQVAFLFGLQVVFLRLGLDSTLTALVLVHLVFVLPYMVFSLVEPWKAWDPRYAVVAHALGHGANSVFWRIRLPMLFRSVLTAAAVGFAVSASQYLPTLLIGGGRWATTTTEAVALSTGGNRRLIGAYALMQMVLPFIGFLLAAALPAIVFRRRRGLWVHS